MVAANAALVMVCGGSNLINLTFRSKYMMTPYKNGKVVLTFLVLSISRMNFEESSMLTLSPGCSDRWSCFRREGEVVHRREGEREAHRMEGEWRVDGGAEAEGGDVAAPAPATLVANTPLVGRLNRSVCSSSNNKLYYRPKTLNIL